MFRLGHTPADFISQREEHGIADAVSDQNGRQPSIVFPEAVLPQICEGVLGILELFVVVFILQQHLDPLERCQDGFRQSSQSGRYRLLGVLAPVGESYF